MLKQLKFLIISIALLAVPLQGGNDRDRKLVAIANKNFKCIGSQIDIKRLYLGHIDFKCGGQVVVPLTYKTDSLLRSKFYNEILDSNKYRLKQIWMRRSYMEENAPLIVNNEQEAVDLVTNNLNMIAFVWSSGIQNTHVKVLSILE